MITILHIAEIILYIILAFNTGYLLLFAIASKFCRPRIYPRTAPGTKFAVLFPAYKEDKVIIPAIYSFLQQDYPRELYDIIVISDQMQESTNEALRQLPVRLLIADYTDSSKAKAMSLANERHRRHTIRRSGHYGRGQYCRYKFSIRTQPCFSVRSQSRSGTPHREKHQYGYCRSRCGQ